MIGQGKWAKDKSLTQAEIEIRWTCRVPRESAWPAFTDTGSGVGIGASLRRLEEVAAGLLSLASDESVFMTGAEFVLDGGVTAM